MEAAHPYGEGGGTVPGTLTVPELDALLAVTPGRHDWSAEEDALLAAYYPKAAAERKCRALWRFMCEKYGPRSLPSMHERARKLGLQGREP